MDVDVGNPARINCRRRLEPRRLAGPCGSHGRSYRLRVAGARGWDVRLAGRLPDRPESVRGGTSAISTATASLMWPRRFGMRQPSPYGSGNGDGSLGPRADYATSSHPAAVAIADFDNDGAPDLAVPTWDASRVEVLHGAGNGSFDDAMAYPVDLNPLISWRPT